MARVVEYVGRLPANTCVVSGGAPGVDQTAEWAAVAMGFSVFSFAPDWTRYGKSAGMIRNAKIVEHCDELVAFWDGASRGTAHSIDLARKAVQKGHGDRVNDSLSCCITTGKETLRFTRGNVLTSWVWQLLNLD